MDRKTNEILAVFDFAVGGGVAAQMMGWAGGTVPQALSPDTAISTITNSDACHGQTIKTEGKCTAITAKITNMQDLIVQARSGGVD